MAHTLFASEFFSSLISSETNSRFSLSDYFENAYGRAYDFHEHLPCLLCRRDVSVTSPFSYEAAGLDAFCLIHTLKGAGRLSYNNASPSPTSYELVPGTLAFIDCRKNHKIICLHNIWEYTICFVSSPISSLYHKKIGTLGNCFFHLDEDPDSLAIWKRLLEIQTDDEIHALMRSRELIVLYTQLYLSSSIKLQGGRHLPSYISDMKKSFDTAYDMPYSLDMLSEKYNVNKFRLCREFTKYCEDSPLQYLNKVRIEKAKELLRCTDEKIGAVGQMVGIDNTNHFIRLFKEKTGVTPSAYRRETSIL